VMVGDDWRESRIGTIGVEYAPHRPRERHDERTST
jgi:hypothetical protein